MKKVLFLFTFFNLIYFLSNSQESIINIDSGNKNDISVVQDGKDSSRKSGISLKKSDSNVIRVNQKAKDTVAVETNEKGTSFMEWINNTNVIIGLIASLVTIASIPFVKKIFRKK